VAARVPAKLAATLSTVRSGAGTEARTRSGKGATSVARDAGAGDGEGASRRSEMAASAARVPASVASADVRAVRGGQGRA
jgi:hypothetical protein